MKKILFAICILSLSKVYGEELRPQFRAWKSSALQAGNYTNVLIATSPIIFHMVIGSGTVGGVGSNYFSLNRSTGNNGSPGFIPQVSTKAYISLNQSNIENSGIGQVWDVFSDSYTYYNKQGASTINILYDFYKYPPSYNPFPND